MNQLECHLLAATRVTKAPIHLGTYYGWIKRINAISNKYRTTVLIADTQSLDRMFRENGMNRFSRPNVGFEEREELIFL